MPGNRYTNWRHDGARAVRAAQRPTRPPTPEERERATVAFALCTCQHTRIAHRAGRGPCDEGRAILPNGREEPCSCTAFVAPSPAADAEP